MTRRVEIAPENWECVRRLSDDTPDDRIEVGPKEDLLAPLDVINMVSQVRQEYDPHDLAELKSAMIVENEKGEKKIQLIQPITVGYFHRNDLNRYLEKLNSTWGTDHTLDELTSLPGSSGRYFLVVVAGHRRTIAIRQAAEELEIDPSRIDVVFHVNHGTHFTFREGIKTQYRENFHKRPESWEDAVAVSAILSEGLRSGEYETFADCARDLGIPPERVSKAYRFEELPTVIQDRVQAGTLGYGAALEIHKIAVAKAFSLVKEQFTTEETEDFLFRFEKGFSLLSDVNTHLKPDQEQEWYDMVVDSANNVSLFKVMAQVRKYTKEQCAALVKYEQLTLASESETVTLVKARRRAVTTIKKILRKSLGDVVDQLDAEIDRLDQDRELLIDWTPDLIVHLDDLRAGLEVIARETTGATVDDLRNSLVASTLAGRLVLAELVDDAQETDSMGDAIAETPLEHEPLFKS